MLPILLELQEKHCLFALFYFAGQKHFNKYILKFLYFKTELLLTYCRLLVTKFKHVKHNSQNVRRKSKIRVK